jgi:hypothetical protein
MPPRSPNLHRPRGLILVAYLTVREGRAACVAGPLYPDLSPSQGGRIEA